MSPSPDWFDDMLPLAKLALPLGGKSFRHLTPALSPFEAEREKVPRSSAALPSSRRRRCEESLT